MEVRCKACDRSMTASDYHWRTDIEAWEDLCGECRLSVFSSETIGELIESFKRIEGSYTGDFEE